MVVIHANVKFQDTCKFCGSPFDEHVESRWSYEGDLEADSYGLYKCGTTLESLVCLPTTPRINGYGPPRSFDERLIERSWACEQLAKRP